MMRKILAQRKPAYRDPLGFMSEQVEKHLLDRYSYVERVIPHINFNDKNWVEMIPDYHLGAGKFDSKLISGQSHVVRVNDSKIATSFPAIALVLANLLLDKIRGQALPLESDLFLLPSDCFLISSDFLLLHDVDHRHLESVEKSIDKSGSPKVRSFLKGLVNVLAKGSSEKMSEIEICAYLFDRAVINIKWAFGDMFNLGLFFNWREQLDSLKGADDKTKLAILCDEVGRMEPNRLGRFLLIGGIFHEVYRGYAGKASKIGFQFLRECKSHYWCFDGKNLNELAELFVLLVRHFPCVVDARAVYEKIGANHIDVFFKDNVSDRHNHPFVDFFEKIIEDKLISSQEAPFFVAIFGGEGMVEDTIGSNVTVEWEISENMILSTEHKNFINKILGYLYESHQDGKLAEIMEKKQIYSLKSFSISKSLDLKSLYASVQLVRFLGDVDDPIVDAFDRFKLELAFSSGVSQNIALNNGFMFDLTGIKLNRTFLNSNPMTRPKATF